MKKEQKEGPNELYNKSREVMQKYNYNPGKNVKEYFSSPSNTMYILTLLLIGLFIQLFLGKFIWNNFLYKLFPGIKKMKSIYEMLALIVFVQIVGYCCY